MLGLSAECRWHDVTATNTFANVLEYRPLVLRSHIPSTHIDDSTLLSLGPYGTQVVYNGRVLAFQISSILWNRYVSFFF